MEDYTTILKRQSHDLSDVYYLSCAMSSEGEKREFHLASSAVKVVLVATLVTGPATYSAHANETDFFRKDVPVMVEQSGRTMSRTGHLTSVGNGRVAIEINQKPSSLERTRKEQEANQERLQQAKRVQMLMASYRKNETVAPVSYSSLWTMRMVNNALSRLPFSDSILQYDSYDDVWQYNLYFDHQLEVTVSAYVGDDSTGNVDYSVYHNGDLLVASELPLAQIVRKLNSVIAKIERNA